MIRFGAAAFAAIFVLSAAIAAADEPMPSVDVAGADWTDPADVAAIHEAIVAQAKAWCEAQYDSAVHTRRAYRRCVAETIAATLEESGHPELIRLAEAEPPQPAR